MSRYYIVVKYVTAGKNCRKNQANDHERLERYGQEEMIVDAAYY